MLDSLPDHVWYEDPAVQNNFRDAEKQINEILPFQKSNLMKFFFLFFSLQKQGSGDLRGKGFH